MLKLRTSNILGDRMDYHHHARLTVRGREELAKSVIEGGLSLREAGSRVQAQPAERCQVGQALPSGGSGWAEGPLRPSPPQPAPDAGRTGSPRRGLTPPALDRRPDRAGTEDRPGHREPHSAPVETQPYPQHRAAAGGGSLRT